MSAWVSLSTAGSSPPSGLPVTFKTGEVEGILEAGL